MDILKKIEMRNTQQNSQNFKTKIEIEDIKIKLILNTNKNSNGISVILNEHWCFGAGIILANSIQRVTQSCRV